ncbi:hypothetical protein DBR33_10320 [Stenotrophomonas sp. HMWF022]|nr:hypothetical protein DBR20_03875 [Stenotrophomonas sp. HMWF023]PTT43529.1 hypothetical protein DBR33_10320 [Stenotrophomonas sp. HMWF022]
MDLLGNRHAWCGFTGSAGRWPATPRSCNASPCCRPAAGTTRRCPSGSSPASHTMPAFPHAGAMIATKARILTAT